MLWQTKGKIDSNNKENSTEGGDKLFIVTADGYLVVINGRENIIPKSNLVVVTSSANEEKNQNQKQNKEDEIIVDHRKKSFGNDSTNNVSASETNSSGTRKNVRFEGDDRDNTKSNDQEQKKVILKKQLKKSKVSETNNDFDSSDDDDDVAMNHDDDDDTDRNDSPPKVKKSRFIDDEAEDDDDEDDISNNNSAMELNNDSTKATPSNGGEDDDIENAIQYEDIDKPSLRHITAPADDNDIDNASDDDASDDSYDRRHQNRRSTNSIVNLPEPQAPFGVSSTPLDLPRRFLCWNHIGSITLLRGDDSTTSSTNRTTIDIHFTNSFSRRNITFTDNLGFILGSLGEDGAIFATDVADDDNDEEDDILGDSYLRGLSKKTKEAVKRDQRTKKNLAKPTGSTLYFNRFETFGNVRDKDWVLTLPSGERVVGCACGEGWAAAITRYVHAKNNNIYPHSRQSRSHAFFSMTIIIVQSSVSSIFFFGWKSRSCPVAARRAGYDRRTWSIRGRIVSCQ